LCLAVCPALAAAPDAIPAELRDLQRKALDDHRAYDTLRDLTGRVGNRLAGSAGDARAVEWALATLRAQGFQNVHAESVTVPHWVRGNASVQLVGTPAVDLTALALGVPFTSNDTGGGADVGPLRRQGVPAFELQHDASKYFEIHHSDADRIDRVNPTDLAFNVAAYATLAWALAEQPAPFARLDRTWPTVSEGVQACEWRP
jgi:hypothetical protein